jgi:predicted PurR-regulated permease PerM
MKKLQSKSWYPYAVALCIAAVLSIYLLLSKDRLKTDYKELLSALLTEEKLNSVLNYFTRCDYIVNRYLVFSLLDSLIAGAVFAVIFIAVSLVLQVADGYIIKPRLFGNSLGISGLLILLAIVTLGKSFGMGGLPIPLLAFTFFYTAAIYFLLIWFLFWHFDRKNNWE